MGAGVRWGFPCGWLAFAYETGFGKFVEAVFKKLCDIQLETAFDAPLELDI